MLNSLLILCWLHMRCCWLSNLPPTVGSSAQLWEWVGSLDMISLEQSRSYLFAQFSCSPNDLWRMLGWFVTLTGVWAAWVLSNDSFSLLLTVHSMFFMLSELTNWQWFLVPLEVKPVTLSQHSSSHTLTSAQGQVQVSMICLVFSMSKMVLC